MSYEIEYTYLHGTVWRKNGLGKTNETLDTLYTNTGP